MMGENYGGAPRINRIAVLRGPGSAVLLAHKTASALAARTRSILCFALKPGLTFRNGFTG